MSFNVLLKKFFISSTLKARKYFGVSIIISICFKNNALFLTQNVSIQLELSVLGPGQTSNMNFL